MKKLLLLILTIILIGCAENGVSGDDFTYVPDNAEPGVLYTMQIGEKGDCGYVDTYNQLMAKCPTTFNNVETWSCVSIDKISSVLNEKSNGHPDVVKRVNSIVNNTNFGLDDFAYANINGTMSWVHTTRCNQILYAPVAQKQNTRYTRDGKDESRAAGVPGE